MRRQAGVTVVEVLFLLIVLGIIAAAMAPRYMDYTEDNRASSVRSMESTLIAAADMAYTRAAYDGVERREHDVIELSSGSLPVRYGYPNFLAAESPQEAENIMLRELNITPDQWNYSYDATSLAVRLSPAGVNPNVEAASLDSISACFVEYLPPEGPGERPQFNIAADDC